MNLKNSSIKCFDLEVNKQLLNNDFEGYKLSLQSLPKNQINLPIPVLDQQLDKNGRCLAYYKLIIGHNHLFYNKFKLEFYYVGESFCIQRLAENLVSFEVVWQIPKTRHCLGQFVLNPTIDFLEMYTVISNGCSDLFILNKEWQLESSFEQVLDNNFIILDSKTINDKELYILLLNLDNEKPSRATISILKLLKIIKWEVIEKKSFKIDGFISFANFNHDCTAIYVIFDGKIGFILDKSPVFIVDKPQWYQTDNDVRIKFFLNDLTNNDLLKFNVKNNQMKVLYKDYNIFDGRLSHTVKNDSFVSSSCCTFNIQERSIEIHLIKNEKILWPNLFDNEEDNDKVQLVQSFMPFESLNVYCSIETEECDVLDTFFSFERFSLIDNKVTHNYSIGNRKFLFTSQSYDDKSNAFVIRHDVDALIWQPEENGENFQLKHAGTLFAMGFVQASKTDKKFQYCAPDFSYSVITDSYQYIYLYFHSKRTFNSEVRNRFSGKRYPMKSEQKVISLSHTDNEILGIHCGINKLFILTRISLYVFNVKQN